MREYVEERSLGRAEPWGLEGREGQRLECVDALALRGESAVARRRSHTEPLNFGSPNAQRYVSVDA